MDKRYVDRENILHSTVHYFFSKFIFEKSRVNEIYNCKMYINIVLTIAIMMTSVRRKNVKKQLDKNFCEKKIDKWCDVRSSLP